MFCTSRIGLKFMHDNYLNPDKYIPRNMLTVFALLCFVVVIHWLIFPYPSGLLHWHCGNLTISPVPAKQPWWIWINTSCEFIMNDCITTTKQSTTKPCAYFLGYTVVLWENKFTHHVWFQQKYTKHISLWMLFYSANWILENKVQNGTHIYTISFQVYLFIIIEKNNFWMAEAQTNMKVHETDFPVLCVIL